MGCDSTTGSGTMIGSETGASGATVSIIASDIGASTGSEMVSFSATSVSITSAGTSVGTSSVTASSPVVSSSIISPAISPTTSSVITSSVVTTSSETSTTSASIASSSTTSSSKLTVISGAAISIKLSITPSGSVSHNSSGNGS